jgi:hypothetical protein
MGPHFKKYFLILLPACLGLLSVFVLANTFLDVFGLFGFREKVRVYGEERFSKYLMSFNYIPRHFEGMILGPSLSANLDPEPFPDEHYFNASIMGARMSNMLSLASNILENNGKIKKAIVCIHPYMTNDIGAEYTDFMKPDTYWKAFGSVNLLRVYGLGLIRSVDLWPNKYPKNQYKSNGCNQFEPLFTVEDVPGRIVEEVDKVNLREFEIGANQRLAFKQLLALLQKEEIQTFIYFHPVPLPIYQAHKDNMQQFWRDILSEQEMLEEGLFSFHNFNTPDFSVFLRDVSNYIDHGHLSKKGQNRLMEEIFRRWDQKE